MSIDTERVKFFARPARSHVPPEQDEAPRGGRSGKKGRPQEESRDNSSVHKTGKHGSISQRIGKRDKTRRTLRGGANARHHPPPAPPPPSFLVVVPVVAQATPSCLPPTSSFSLLCSALQATRTAAKKQQGRRGSQPRRPSLILPRRPPFFNK